MGGCGSGQMRWRNSAAVEETRELDLSQLRRAGCLEPGWHGRVPVTISGKVSDPVVIHVGFDHVGVAFQTSDSRGRQHRTQQTINIVRVRCRFGGNRMYFICPGVDCGRRILKLYWPVGGYVLCRNCHHLAYLSQSLNELDRIHLRRGKIQRRLGGGGGTSGRPKGMWATTYARLLDELSDAEIQFDEAFTLGAARLLGRLK